MLMSASTGVGRSSNGVNGCSLIAALLAVTVSGLEEAAQGHKASNHSHCGCCQAGEEGGVSARLFSQPQEDWARLQETRQCYRLLMTATRLI